MNVVRFHLCSDESRTQELDDVSLHIVLGGCSWMAKQRMRMLYTDCQFQNVRYWDLNSTYASSSLPVLSFPPTINNHVQCKCRHYSTNRWPKATTFVSLSSSHRMINCVPLQSFVSTYCGKHNSTSDHKTQTKVSPGWISNHRFTLPSE